MLAIQKTGTDLWVKTYEPLEYGTEDMAMEFEDEDAAIKAEDLSYREHPDHGPEPHEPKTKQHPPR